MVEGIPTPARAMFWFVPGQVLFLLISVAGILCFGYIIARRMLPLMHAQPDPRFDRPLLRAARILQFWLGQWRHPRYWGAGVLHILIFAGFILLATRAFALLGLGLSDSLAEVQVLKTGHFINTIQQYATTVVFLCMIAAAVRRLVFKPARYSVPAKYGKAHTADAIFLLALIAIIMLADSAYEGSKHVATLRAGGGETLAVLSLPWLVATVLSAAPLSVLTAVNLTAFMSHELTFFFLLCYRPFGIQFHVETSIFSIYFAKLDRGAVKPVRWGVSEEQLDQVKSLGVKTFEDFTWKHMLDFYSCADCGRCSDQCPSNAVGRPLSPRFFTIKARDYSFQHYPVIGRSGNHNRLVGNVYSEDEVWSCTTCGACEQECPLLIEYIDKIVDLRRGLIDDGNVPQSLQKPLQALERRGNPYGKVEKKRAEWTKAEELQGCAVRVVGDNHQPGTLYFVDSITSYDARMQSIAKSTARILTSAGEDFAILGAEEKDSGHEVRRFGEETLFLSLRNQNSEGIKKSGATRIVTADPHAFNALKHDYSQIPPVEHLSQFLERNINRGALKFSRIESSSDVYTYHDPCYLGRHNGVYDPPRNVLDAIPGLKRVEMQRCRDRSFCCGGGGLMLFYEPKEEQRMGVVRVRMAADAGANVIVTACPFCMANIEDAIKVAGLEGSMTAIDLAELVDRQMLREGARTEREVITASLGG